MFSKLLLPKIIIVLIAAYFMYTPVDYSNRNYILNGYTDKMSVNTHDTIGVFIQPTNNFKKAYFILYDLFGNKKDTIISPVYQQLISTTNPWSNGFNYKKTFSYIVPEHLESNIYLFEKKIPVIIKNQRPADIVIVYPLNDINLNSNIGGKSFYPYNSSDTISSDTLSFKRPYTIGIDPFLKDFFLWISKQSFNINYVTDIDLDKSSSFNYAKILIIVGTSSSWTRKARVNFDNYISKGGNALILSASSIFWSARYNENKDKIIVYKNCNLDPDRKDPTCSWSEKDYSAQNSIVTDLEYGGYPAQYPYSFGGFKITAENSPLLVGTNLKKEDTLRIKNRIVDGMFIDFKKYSSKVGITIKDSFYNNCFKKELIGFEMASRKGDLRNGVFIVIKKNKNSGIIINTASSDWCSNQGIGGEDSLRIQQITLNMMNLLLNDQNVFSPIH